MQRLLVICAFSCLSLTTAAFAQAQTQPTPTFRILENIAYQNEEPAERADVYISNQPATTAPLPAVIWMHGNHHDKADARERSICSQLASAGYVAISINYGSWPDSDVGEEHSPRILQNIVNARNAVRFFRAHAADYSIDPSRIALFGGSAGGWLALMVGLTNGDSSFDSTPPYPGVSSSVCVIGDFYADIDPWLKSKITAKSPPVLIVHGKADPDVDYHQSIELSRSLSAVGVTNELILLENTGHGFDFRTWNKTPLPQDLRPVVLAFLQTYLVLSSPARRQQPPRPRRRSSSHKPRYLRR